MSMPDTFKNVPTIGEGRDAKEFAPGLPQIKRERLIGVVVKVEGARIIEDWDSQFGTSDFALVRLQLANGDRVSSLWGGKAIVKAVRLYLKHNEFPRLAVLDTAASQATGNMYYYLRKPEEDDSYEVHAESQEVAA